MKYSILSAAYANEERTAAIVKTTEAGAILASQADTPELWKAMQAAAEVSDYTPPALLPVDVIENIERENPITHRALRELILTIGEAFPGGKDTVLYQRVLVTELAIRAERAKL